MKNYGSFNLLKKIAWERIGGSEKELEAANIIKGEIEKLGLEAKLEGFEVDFPTIKNAKLEILEPKYKEYTVTGYGMTGSTNKEGVEAEFYYLQNENDIDHQNIEGKIVLCNRRLKLEEYKKLVNKKVAGAIFVDGSVYDNINSSDLTVNVQRPKFYENGKFPAVTMRALDAHKMLVSSPTKVRLTLVEDENHATSHNVITEIKGKKYPNEVIVFTAHYDSVIYSTGAYDNGTGSTTIFELLNYFVDHQPDRTCKFIWCGSEEKGLLGAKAFVKDHEKELEQYVLCINVDMTGVALGFDFAGITGETNLQHYIDYLAAVEGFQIKTQQCVYSSDSTPFADNGIPAVSFARLTGPNGAQIHSRKDVMTFLDSKNYYETCSFIEKFASNIINSKIFPIKKTMPDNMKDELDYYLMRKERPQK